MQVLRLLLVNLELPDNLTKLVYFICVCFVLYLKALLYLFCIIFLVYFVVVTHLG